jgi:hypothetical protein
VSPDFEDLVGTELEPGERARLERVHELLVAAGPPPDYIAPTEPIPLRPRRRRGLLVPLAAALAVTVFAFGAALVTGPTSAPETVAMEGTAAAPGASASLEILELDPAGNWPMRFAVEGLTPAASGRPFELWLTRGGKLSALCGSFLTDQRGTAAVPMNAPYDFTEYDGWVVVEEGTDMPLLTT